MGLFFGHLVLLGGITSGADQNPNHARVPVPGGRVQRGVPVLRRKESINHIFFFYEFTHVVLNVRFASIEKENPACFVVPVLAAEVKRGKPSSVFDVEICLEIH